MGLFGGGHPGAYVAPANRGIGLRGALLILGIAFGLYFLNLAFLWVKIPALSDTALKPFNILTGILLILLGIMAVKRHRY